MAIKKIFKFLLYLSVFLSFFMVFFPVKNLYFLMENKLNEKNIIINEESLKENLYSFKIEKSSLYLNKDMKASINKSELKYFLFYNQLNLRDIRIDKSFWYLYPMHVDFIKCDFSILDPLNIHISSSGEFGELKGKVNLLKQEMSFSLKPSNGMKNSSRMLLVKIKEDKGVYSYVYKY